MNGIQRNNRSRSSASPLALLLVLAVLVAVFAVLFASAGAAFAQTGSGEMFECREASIGMEGVSFAPCYGKRMGGELSSPQRAEELARLRDTFAPFTATTAAGDVVFNGTGTTEATPAQQRLVAEWAAIVNLEAGAGRTGAAYGNVFAMTREGGIAALCQTVTAYVTGVAYVVDCRSEPPTALPVIVLDAGQLERLFMLYDRLPIFEISRTDGTADVMTTSVFFDGRGEGEATDDDKATVEAFAAELAAQAQAAAR